MSRYPHKTKSQRKIITLQEWANYTGLSRQTINAYLTAYKVVNEYDSHDIYSVFDFLRFLLNGKELKKRALNPA
jgi:hypothetical protein